MSDYFTKIFFFDVFRAFLPVTLRISFVPNKDSSLEYIKDNVDSVSQTASVTIEITSFHKLADITHTQTLSEDMAPESAD